ncbi:DUF1553 domain-containing protein [Allorhodopirellula solitaria]|uniref:Xanthan lyase n=1 Tax=Allorhodopirellula solitaria TaxID=2527987 RepID=A0A5C5YJY8_9BACT|nr:DUF1553 domain-containing protein [Allorhodopirellula solitaria]TWT75161.1 Xanthan lyase precursor [Allorhodopirellula solitaria]
MRAHLKILIASWTFLTGATLPGGIAVAQSGDPTSAAGHAAKVNFFESKIRPILVEHCMECHAADTEASGGLLLDSRDGWQAGGDSGSAITVGKSSDSLLMQAIRYDDPYLQMPPEGALPASVIRDFEKWIDDGATDPREATGTETQPPSSMSVEDAQQHWAYQPLPESSETTGSKGSRIDELLNRQLAESGLTAVPATNHDALVRRLTFDLTGLPPHGDDRDKNVSYDETVERLLDSPGFGEHFARKWMDVARYAESITLRGFILPEAWRYRDYLVTAFAEDRPFDQMIREQVAGDLLPHDSVDQHQTQSVATGFLTLGNTNLEKQDKDQLEMDYIDEQLEVIGRAFLAQTIGCARCHDHKFDPIPTSDYYALAGIMSSTVALKHSNVSKWVERPLPIPEDEAARFDAIASQLAATERKLTAAQKNSNTKLVSGKRSISVADLAGVVVDSRDAALVGQWVESTSVGRFVGSSYLHDRATGQGEKSATFEPPSLTPGDYIVRMAYTPGANRASNALVGVFSADGESKLRINQRKKPSQEDTWISLGTFRFEQDGQAFVLVSNEAANGHVIADAVQFLPVASLADGLPSEDAAENANEPSAEQIAEAKLQREIKSLQAEKAELEAELGKRPRYMTLIENEPPQDIAIHIRGDVHHLGEVVPRGVLTAIGETPAIAAQSSGRRELADWLSSADNPLTARVYANRVWSWLMGRGLVASVNNFGTTGSSPTHPELLDWLASELIRSGWSTKHLVRTIVQSEAYRRRCLSPEDQQRDIDPDNKLYWCGQTRRLSAEQIRDAMLAISGELDRTQGGSLIRPGTRSDYGYQHQSTRRSLYQPVFRNSLPEMFEAFDFADPSVSVGNRSQSTVATQALVLMNHPWVVERATAAADHFRSQSNLSDDETLIEALYQECFYRSPTPEEIATCRAFLHRHGDPKDDESMELLVHAMFASLDFRYLE